MRRACKRDLAAIYQDVEREDGCSYDNYEDTGVPLPKADCIISKAVKYEDHDLCHYIYDKISDHNSAAYAPTIFEKYFGYGSYKQTGEMTYRDACLTMVAYRANDPVICDQVEYETERNMCRYFVKQRNIKSLDELEEL